MPSDAALKELVEKVGGRRKAMVDVRESNWRPHWEDIGDYILPWRQRWTQSDANKGTKRHTFIMDNSAEIAARTLQSGMATGISNPARPWFNLAMQDPDLNTFDPVREWLADTTTRVREVLSRSNFYKVAPEVYIDIGGFGTAGAALLEDPDDVIRGHSFPIGTFALDTDHRNRPNSFTRDISMTVAQLVSNFGEDKLPPNVVENWNEKRFGIRYDVAQLVEPNKYWQEGKLGILGKKWISVYWMLADNNNRPLRIGGFNEFPILGPRWATLGEDVYGSNCPGMMALPDVRALQLLHKKLLKATDKMIDPPMTGPSSMKGKPASTLPGSFTYSDAPNERAGFRAAHDVRFDINAGELKVQQHQGRVDRAFFADLWLLISRDPRSQPATAREIAERHEEKLIALGPTLENTNDEFLKPTIDRVMAVMDRRNLLMPPPPEIAGRNMKVEFVSILAQAQKLIGLQAVERLMGQVGAMAGINQEVVDKIDFDEAVDVIADMMGVPPSVVRDDDMVDAIRAERAQQAQAAQQAAVAREAVSAGKEMSETDTSGQNALTDVLGRNVAGVPET